MRAAATVLAALLFVASVVPAGASQAPPPRDPGVPPPRLRLYVESPDAALDSEFLHRELAWVDWVRDRADADVIVLLTVRDTGSGGSEGTFYVSRPRGGGPAQDTLRVFSPPTASDDEERRLIARTLAAALARDLAVRPEGAGLEVRVAAPHQPPPPPRDRWNHWVYKLSGNGYLNGERSYDEYNLSSTFTASRLTEASRMGARLTQRYAESHYDFSDGTSYTSVFRSWNMHALVARSVGARWAFGTSVNLWSSTYSNMDLSAGVGPAVEFDVFPYAESSRRALTIAWQLYPEYDDYTEETLYGKTTELLLQQEIDLGFARKEPWGSINLNAGFFQYLDHPDKYRLNVYGETSLKLFRGFSLDLDGSASRVRNQLSLPRAGASDSEVLVRQRQLATSFSYYLSFGLSYRFGSIFDNAVNTRLENTLGTL